MEKHTPGRQSAPTEQEILAALSEASDLAYAERDPIKQAKLLRFLKLACKVDNALNFGRCKLKVVVVSDDEPEETDLALMSAAPLAESLLRRAAALR